jgi:hypothetical protein
MVIGSLFINVYSFTLSMRPFTLGFLLIPDSVAGKDYPLFIVSRTSTAPKGVAFVLRVTILPF